MKRVLIIAILLASAGITAFGSDASAARSAAPHPTEGQVLGQILGRRNRRQRRHDHDNNGNVRYETRIVHKGNKTYRDTYRITWKNGKEKVKRVSHVRIG